MSDRPNGSVRTGARDTDGPAGVEPAAGGAAPGSTAPGGTTPDPQAPAQPTTDTGTHAIPGAGTKAAAATGAQQVPSTGTQAIPTTGTQRAAAAPATGSQRAAAPATGSQRATAAPTAPPAPASGSAPASAHPASAPAAAGAPATAASSGPASGSRPATGPTVTATKGRGRTSGRGPRRARLQLRHIDTWSALKISLVLSIALFFIWMVAVGVLYGVLNGLGVFDTLNELFGQLGTENGTDAGSDVLTPGVVFGGAAIIGAINIVLLTALCTVGTFIYNMCSDLVGGLELTLSERD